MMKKRDYMNSYLRVREAQSSNAGKPKRNSDINRRGDFYLVGSNMNDFGYNDRFKYSDRQYDRDAIENKERDRYNGELTSYHTYLSRDTYGEDERREGYGRSRTDERYDNRYGSDLLTTKPPINRKAVLLNIVTLIMFILIAVMTVYNVSLAKKEHADIKKSSDKQQIIDEEVLNKSENGDLIPPIEPIK